MMQKIRVLSLLSVVFAAHSAFGVELLVNGDFENEPNFGSGFSNDAGYSGFTGAQIPGWTVEAGHGATIHNTVLYPTISGNYSLNTDGEGLNGVNADLFQDFATVNGTPYLFSFDYQGWVANGQPRLDVSLTDTNTNSNVYTYNAPYSALLFSPSFGFIGNGNVIRLRVRENPQSGFNDNTFIADNFSVRTVPEPAPVAVLGLGVAVLLRRRKR